MLRTRLGHVYWVGGGSGAGKSTIARRLAAQHDLPVYSADEAMADHHGRFRPQDAPLLSEFRNMDMDQRWLNRSPQTMLETFHWFHGELFKMIVDDRMFTERLRQQVLRLGLPAIEISTTMTEDDLTGRVTKLFGL